MRERLRRFVLRAAWATFLMVAAAPAAAQAQQAPELRISTGVVPDTVTVGDPFQSILRIEGEFEAVEFFQVTAGDTIQPVDTMQVTGGDAPTAIYTLVAWQTGDDLQAILPVRIVLVDGESQMFEVGIRLPVVRSVLPADTALHTPRPDRGLLDAPIRTARDARWWWLLLALPLLALLGWWLLRRRRSPRPVEREDPRERARRRLAEIEGEGLVRPDRFQFLYPAATRVIRDFLGEIDPRLGSDLTTTELVARLAELHPGDGRAERIRELLVHADTVKFARHRPSAGELDTFWSNVSRTVEEFATHVETLEEVPA